MHHPPPHSPPPPDQLELPPTFNQDLPSSSSPFNFSDFLDFSEEALNLPFPQSESHQSESQLLGGVDHSPLLDNSGSRVRKRDPRLVCSNFLAGRIPCACPELDEKLEEEEGSAGLPGRKRTRTRPRSGAPIRCQVPECDADISELKGYHRRHRVCLSCANATTVVLDGESKRYCQQCGKFHVLSDFDEGKRSCRRKLERHNNRRRRKSNDPKDGMENESLQINSAECGSGDDETAKDGVSLTSQIEERETLDSDGQFSALCSYLGLDNPQTDSAVQFTATGEAPSGDTLNPNYTPSLSDYDNKNTYSSLCPSGRISFKLYDWNPAEFPRRLRHQIFQWLASMPIELEGYIRPGCTILTAFFAMPKTAWHKLLDEPALHIKNLVSSPGSLLSGRDTMHVYLNDMIFRVERDAISVVKIKVMDQAPKLHYIYPTCFEVGKPMDFVACGNNLLQPNFRFLISLAGRYMAYNVSASSMKCEKGDANWAGHQLLKIHVPQVNMDIVGAAFVEVENQSGLSNFVPILICDSEIFSEMNILQQQLDIELPFQDQQLLPSTPSCEDFASRRRWLSEFILDVAWFLRKPVSEQLLTSTDIQRLNHLLNFLIEINSNIILEKVLHSLKYSIDNNLLSGISDSEVRFLREKVDIAQSKLSKKLIENYFPEMRAEDGFDGSGTVTLFPGANQGVEKMVENVTGLSVSSPSVSLNEDPTLPLLKRDDVIMNVNIQNRPRESRSSLLMRTGFTLRPLTMAVVSIAVCSAICLASFHPQRVNQIAMSTLRWFSDSS